MKRSHIWMLLKRNHMMLLLILMLVCTYAACAMAGVAHEELPKGEKVIQIAVAQHASLTRRNDSVLIALTDKGRMFKRTLSSKWWVEIEGPQELKGGK